MVMAHAMRKVAAKKMAKGGKVEESASNEKRAMPSDEAGDAKQTNQSKKNEGGSIPKPKLEHKKGPSMAKSSVIKARPYDHVSELDLQDSAKPTKHEGMSEDKGPSKEEALESKRAAPMLAKGGVINKAISMDSADQDGEEHPAGLESDNDMMGDKDAMLDHFADGGEVPSDEAMMEHAASIAAGIMAKRAHKKFMALGGEVDIEDNAEEMPNDMNSLNKLALKENYDEGMKSMSQPKDSNEHADSREDESENKHDKSIVSKIMKKRKSSPISK